MLTEHTYSRVVIWCGDSVGPVEQTRLPPGKVVTALMDLTAQRLHLAITTATQARNARHTIGELAAKVLNDANRAHDVELMAGEAIANSWLHGTKPITVTCYVVADRLQVEVRDRGPGLPVIPRGDYQRGLRIIDELSTSWRLQREEDAAETVLIFEVNL